MNIAMGKTIHKWLFLSAALFSGLLASTASAQDYNMQIRLKDGTLKSVPTSKIASIEFKEDQPGAVDGLTGKWMLIASPAGVAGEGGIHTSTIDTIRFTASATSEEGILKCHADTFYIQSGMVYSADWQVQVGQNEQDGTRRLGWTLSEQAPVYTNDSASLYLLSENIATGRLEGMTLWSDWQTADSTTFTFPKNQQIYGVFSSAVPYDSSSASYLEIWASPRFIKQ